MSWRTFIDQIFCLFSFLLKKQKCLGFDGEFRESGLKGTVQYGSPPCTNQLSLAAFEIIFYSFTKQPILTGKSNVLSRPISVSPIYLTIDLMNSRLLFFYLLSADMPF
jgi:hypothetical protein